MQMKKDLSHSQMGVPSWRLQIQNKRHKRRTTGNPAMVAAPPDSNLPHPTTTASMEEEEALKRNTDCVYFLASPLTCKKGNDCEYRHSEYARVNPRDCWYWMTSNCLNQKCAFRHPPLDGLLGTQTGGPVGVSIPARQSSFLSASQAPHDVGKQAVPCIFFLKGFCVKGDRCAFLHGISPAGSKLLQSHGAGHSSTNSFPNKALLQSQGAGPSAVNSSPNKTIGGLKKCSQDPPKGNPNTLKPTPTPVASKTPVAKAETVFSVEVNNIEKNIPTPQATNDRFSTYRPPTTTLANGILHDRISRVQQDNIPDDYSSYKDKEADEFLKESSPGFDVLVDDELGVSDYYHGEDQYVRLVGHEGRQLSSMEEYNPDRAEAYGAMSDLDREMFHHERSPRENGWDQHHEFSPRCDGWAFFKGRSPDRVVESDLRHRLSKQRRVHGLRSVVSHDFIPENHSSRGSSHSREGSTGSRLTGRIKFPERWGAANGSNVYPERETDTWGRNPAGRMYPGGRFRERLRGCVNDDHNGGGRNINGGSRARKELVDDQGTNFAGPKSLSELKCSDLLSKALRSSITVGCESSFDGPKSLSILLKRKRGAKKVDNHSDLCLTKTADPRDEQEQPESLPVDTPFEQMKDIEKEDRVTMDDGYEDPEIDGEYYEEQGEEGDYNYDESEHVDIVADGEEYLDDDEGREHFAKKVGVMFS